MKNKIIKTEYKDVTVKKLPLGQYAEVFKLIQGFTKNLTDVDKLNSDQLVQNFPMMVSEALPEAIKIIAIVSDLTEEEAKENIGLDEAVDILIGAWEINKYSKVVEAIKKATAQRNQPKEA